MTDAERNHADHCDISVLAHDDDATELYESLGGYPSQALLDAWRAAWEKRHEAGVYPPEVWAICEDDGRWVPCSATAAGARRVVID
jgi:hypothetical protein